MHLTDVDNAPIAILITVVLTTLAIFGFAILRKKLYASAVDQALSREVRWLAWQDGIHDFDEKARLEIAMIQIRVLKYSYSAGLAPDIAAETMLASLYEFMDKLDSDTV